MKSIGIIPSRFASTRFPGKPLIDLLGKSMIQRVYEQAQKATQLDQVIVATDDQRIYDHVKTFDGEVMMTSSDHQTGTSRCAEVASAHTDATLIVNIQGDEPIISPQQIDELIGVSSTGIATQARRICSDSDLFDSNLVKVVFNQQQKALYFSRQAIPYGRNHDKKVWLNNHIFYQHIGLYSYDRDTLLDLKNLPESSLENMESLEQLRWLDYGIPITVGLTEYESISIDNPEDVSKVLRMLDKKS